MWGITVLSMVRYNVSRYSPLAMAAIYVATGDYASFFRYMEAIIK